MAMAINTTLTTLSSTAFTNLSTMSSNSSNASDHMFCIPLAIHQFPGDAFSKKELQSGGVIMHLLAALYIFGSLAYLCDTYFVPALEVLSDRLKLKTDVAGATFMAIGSSSPELFTSLVGVYVAEDDVGVGAIIGSAVFNILFVIGCCILASPIVLEIEVYPIVRDASYYALALIPLATICMDRDVTWYDALSLVLMYGFYIFMMYHSERLEALYYRCFPSQAKEGWSPHQETTPILCGGNFENAATKNGDVTTNDEKKVVNNTKESSLENGTSFEARLNKSKEEVQVNIIAPPTEREDTDWKRDIYPPDGKYQRILWAIGLPMVTLFWLTIPNVAHKRLQKLFPLTFLVSLIYIGSLSYVMVWMVTVIGYVLKVPDIVMGLVFIAAGASVPDALASIIVARHGLGKMSVSNCIGSNVFDVLLGLGIPWLFKTLVTDYGTSVPIHSGSIKFTVLILMTSIVAMLGVFILSRWKLRKRSGIILIMFYVCFMIISCLFEMNVFGKFNLPQCE